MESTPEELAITPPVGAIEMLPERPHPEIVGYAPIFTLTDQSGKPFHSDSLSGVPWIAHFTDGRDTGVGAHQGDLLSSVLDWVKGGTNSMGIRIISFTVNPSNDPTEVLRKRAIDTDASKQMWQSLTGSIEAMRSVLLRGDFKRAINSEGQTPEEMLQGARLVLVDAYQRIRGLYEPGHPQTIHALATDLAALQAEIINIPSDVQDPSWLDAQVRSQRESAKSIQAFHDFGFSDRRKESGIRFMHKIVDDSGKRFKGVHYDHGSGIVVADVDGDARLDIYFVNQVGGNELWRNLGDGKFEDITERAGVFVSDRIGVSAAFADIDNDGDPDLFVTALRKGNVLFENLGKGQFRNITAGSGLTYKGHPSSAVFFDYDRDGLLDLLVTNVGRYTTDEATQVTMEGIRGEADIGDQYYLGFEDAFAGHLKPERAEPSRLYRNIGKRRFADVSSETGLVDLGWTGDAAPVDIDSDGWTDLYMLNMQGNDQVFLNRNGKRFDRAAKNLFPKTSWGAMGIKAMDFENDGDLDIFITDMHSDMSQHVGPGKEREKATMQWPPSFLQTEGSSVFGNTFFRQTEKGVFEEVSDALGAENYWPWGLSVDDLNADGFDDAFLTSSMNFPLRYSMNTLLLNDLGKKWRHAECVLGVEPRTGGLAVPWFELDLLGADKEAPVLELLESHGANLDQFPDRVVVWGAMGSRSSVIFDVDDDGDLDIVTNEMNHHPMVLLSNLSEKKSDMTFLKVNLIGTHSNRSGLGAVVRIRSAELHLMKVKDGQSGYLSHSDFPLYFGLGSVKQVDSLEVTWPSGIIQEIKGPIRLNQTLRITESGIPSNLQIPQDSDPKSPATPHKGAFHVHPGEDIQDALEQAARDPKRKHIIVHAGTYRPQQAAQALIWFNRRHDGITMEADGEVILTAANPEVAKASDASYPAIVNHVIYFGDGISRKTMIRGFKITGANGFVTDLDEPVNIQPPIDADNLKRAKFFYTDGGGIKIFGRSYPSIENVEVYDNFSSPCGAGISIEHRDHVDGSRLKSVLLRNCIFRGNRCPISGAGVDLLHGSAAEILNCLFIGNLSNEPMNERAETPGKWKPQHGSGALTLFPRSRVIVRKCTFTGNRNAIDDSNRENIYQDSIFWMNNAPGGWPPGARYELDLASGVGVSGCFLDGDIPDLENSLDKNQNVIGCPDPQFDSNYIPQAKGFEGVGYRPH
ncbi:MAG: FG-GAP-like repeat-containing protein [Verrucomicrobiota bacterium]|nr:FG-GAP-like repeat-containing protein [Verrucomicrobiota bacterium]